VHRNYTTDIVLKRLSATLIESVNHEFFELLGHLNDNKHSKVSEIINIVSLYIDKYLSINNIALSYLVIPKELVKQCRYGCPSKIEQFCLTWKTLQQGKFLKIYLTFNKYYMFMCCIYFCFLDNIQEISQKSYDTTVNSLNAPISSRGRHILPPLCYWTGE